MISFDKERFSDSSFPFSINTVPVENNFPIHIHDFCELVIVLQGSAVHQVNKRHYGISAGDIFLLRKNVPHGFIHVNKLLLCNIMFYPEKILLPLNDLKYEEEFHDFLNLDEPELENQFYRNRLRLSFEKLMEIKSFVNQMNNEYNKKFQGYIGVVPDDSNLYEELTGYENLCFCASLYGILRPKREARARQLLEVFKLSDAANRRFKTYSRGMKRKLTIAASIVHDPEILFLDEPTTGIDVASSRQIRNLIKNLNSAGTTIFLTTHYIEEAERLCGRIAFINRGKIIKLDTVDRFIEDINKSNVIEVLFESRYAEKNILIEKLKQSFPELECSFKNENTIKVISQDRIDVSPIVSFLSSNNIYILEARLVRPTLEDAFVKLTGIEVDVMKKEKEKK